jgi:hypothetical protein
VEGRSIVSEFRTDKAHSCVVITCLRERKARLLLASVAARATPPTATVLHLHSPPSSWHLKEERFQIQKMSP